MCPCKYIPLKITNELVEARDVRHLEALERYGEGGNHSQVPKIYKDVS